MGTILVTGGTGTFGSKLVPILTGRGHEVRVLSRRPGRGTHTGDLATGEGVAAAGAGADLVVHAASDTARPRDLGRSDPDQTRRLLTAIPDCRHLLYISIVGIDAIPFRYYRSKLECERLISASQVPSTILRATQFHELIAYVLTRASRWPVAALPLNFRFQSVAAGDVATRAADLIGGEPLGRAPDFGGPHVLTGRQLAHEWQAHRGRPKIVLGLRWPGELYRAFAEGRNTCPDHADGTQTWSDFLTAN